MIILAAGMMHRCTNAERPRAVSARERQVTSMTAKKIANKTKPAAVVANDTDDLKETLKMTGTTLLPARLCKRFG
jgi:hypothetical protein